MKTKKKLYWLFAVLLTVLFAMTAVFITACGSDDDEGDKGSQDENTSTSEVTPLSVSLDKSSLDLVLGGTDTGTVGATVTGNYSWTGSEWTVADNKVATISTTGAVAEITAAGVGTTTVTVTLADGVSSSCTVSVTEAHVHTYGEVKWTFAPSTTGEGYIGTASKSCTAAGCDGSRDATIAVSAGAVLVEGSEEATDPGCLTEGTAIYTATVILDGEEITGTGTVTLPATGHNWDDGMITQDPTCTAAGVMTYTCIDCQETKTEAVPATGHTTDSSSYSMTLGENKTQGSSVTITTRCAVCQTTLSTDNSTISDIQTVAATCSAEGSTTYTAYLGTGSDQITVTFVETIEKTAHTAPVWTDVTAGDDDDDDDKDETGGGSDTTGTENNNDCYKWTIGTATAQGDSVTIDICCTVCGEVIESQTVQLTSVTTNAATCENAGSTTYEASVTQSSQSVEITYEVTLAKLGHSYPADTKANADAGYITWGWENMNATNSTVKCTIKCTRCNTQLAEETVEYCIDAANYISYRADVVVNRTTYTSTCAIPDSVSVNIYGADDFTGVLTGNTNTNIVITLTSDVYDDAQGTILSALNSALETEGDDTVSITVLLDGFVLDFSAINVTTVADVTYSTSGIEVANGSKLVIANGRSGSSDPGTLVLPYTQAGTAGITAVAGATLELENIEVVSANTYFIYADGDDGEDTTEISVTSVTASTINDEGKDNTAIYVGGNVEITISKSDISADRQGLVVRGGTAYVYDTVITITGAYTDNATYVSSEDNTPSGWGEGNNVVSGAIVLGNATVSANGSGDQSSPAAADATTIATKAVFGNVTAVVPVGETAGEGDDGNTGDPTDADGTAELVTVYALYAYSPDSSDTLDVEMDGDCNFWVDSFIGLNEIETDDGTIYVYVGIGETGVFTLNGGNLHNPTYCRIDLSFTVAYRTGDDGFEGYANTVYTVTVVDETTKEAVSDATAPYSSDSVEEGKEKTYGNLPSWWRIHFEGNHMYTKDSNNNGNPYTATYNGKTYRFDDCAPLGYYGEYFYWFTVPANVYDVSFTGILQVNSSNVGRLTVGYYSAGTTVATPTQDTKCGDKTYIVTAELDGETSYTLAGASGQSNYPYFYGGVMTYYAYI